MDNWSGKTLKGYQLIERIGAGGFGAVYRARQSTVDREVAVKIILPGFANQPDFIRRFETEAQVVARLEHPYITPLYDYWRDPEGAYLVMRWLRGGSLHTALKDGPFDLASAAVLVDQVCSALALAHRSGIIHRDLKPGNILLDEDSNAYLADFGIAKVLKDVSAGLTKPDDIVGSLDYISPEQARGEPVTPCTDIYSLGVVLYEVLTGGHPFPNCSAVERLYKHINDPLPLIEQLDPAVQEEINAIIQKATAKDPAHRYPDVLALAVAFREGVRSVVAPTEENIVEQLTLREQEILQCIADGLSNKEIANNLFISEPTVKWHIRQVYRKLGVRSRVQAMVRARELDLIISSEREGEGRATRLATSTTGLPEPENPYKGLLAFQPADHLDFFGREELVDKLIGRMAENHALGRFLAVVGPSGSGKSSLVKAGLIPALWAGKLPGSERWFVVDMLPGAHPLDELEVALTRLAANQASNLREQLVRDERGLLRAAGLILPNDGSELVLVVDQFEELFTLVSDDAERVHFMNLLRAAVTETRSRVRVVLTLRADFYDRPLRYPEFGDLVRQRMETLLPLTAKGLERAIVGPAERVGVRLEEGLVATIVGEMNYQSGALPLLQYALTELFEQRDGRWLTNQAYREIGGAVGALAQRADEVYLSLDPVGQELARQMFLRLVTLGEGTTDTRRRTPRSELLAIASDDENADLIDEIIDTYAAYRLLSLDHDPATRTPTVEVAHEAILREWERLRNWLNDCREEIRWQRQLAQLAGEWQAAKRDVSFLLHGSRLEQFAGWMAGTQLALTPTERAYMETSVRDQQRREDAEQQRHEQELETQRQLAEKRQEAANRLRYLVAALSVFLVAALGLSLVAVDREQQAQTARDSERLARAEAEDSLRRTNAQRLGLESTSLVQENGEADLIGLLAVQSLSTQYTPQGDLAAQQAMQIQYPQHVIATGSPIGNDCIAISPNGELLAIGGMNGVITIVSTRTNTVINEMSANGEFIHDITFVGDNKRVAIGGGPFIRVFDVETGDEIFTRDAEDQFGKSIAYVPEGNILAVGSSIADVLLLDASTWEEIRRLETPSGAFDMGVSPDGRYLLTSESAGSITRMWDMTTFSQIAAFNNAPQYATEPQMSPDGKHLAVVTAGGGLFLWAVDQPGNPVFSILHAHLAESDTVAFTPDGRTLITGSLDTLVKFWDVETGQPAAPDLPHPAQVMGLVLSRDGSQLYTVGTDSNLRIWDTVFDNPVSRIPSQRHWYNQAFSPDGQKVASIRYNELRITDLVTGDVFLYEHTTMLNPVAYSHDGQYVLSGTLPPGGQIGEVLLMDVAEKRIVRSFDWEGWLVLDVGFSEDDRWVIASGVGGIIIWDVETGERVFARPPVTSIPITVTFAISPDNHYLIASSGWGEKAELIDLETGEVIWETPLIPSESGVAFSPDGQYFVIGDGSRIAQLRETETQTHVRDFVGHFRGITAVDFSPDGQWLISGSEDGTARVWKVATGEEVRRFQFDLVAHVLFSPDGEHILVDDATNVTIWNVDIADDIAYLCDHITRDFTEDERMLYEINSDEPTCQPGIN